MSDDPQGKAIRFLFENVDSLDLNCAMVKDCILPLLVGNSALSSTDLDRVQAYINGALQ